MRNGHESGEEETISPPRRFVEQANITDTSIYRKFNENWPFCWERVAAFLDWTEEYTSLVEPIDHPPYFRWFVGAKINASYNCVDRHVDAGRGNDTALRWIGDKGVTRTYTYADLQAEVNETAALLRNVGVEKGESVALYLPRIPELPIMMLAAARIGAPHVVVFGEYSASILASFMRETDTQVLVTGGSRKRDYDDRTLESKAKTAVDELNWDVTTITVTRRRDDPIKYGLDYHDLRQEHRGKTVAPVERASDDPLFVCYASGPTGEPIGMEHVVGDYLSYVTWTAHAVLDIKPGDTFWCPAGIEWITGHSYVVYGPLSLGATTILYEGTPDYSDQHHPWEIIENNEVTQFYTTPTAIRTFMDWGAEYPSTYDLSSLRLLGTVGQRIDPDAWTWFYENVGNERCPIVDTWYQAETGGINISTLPGVCDMKPGSVGPALPGIDAAVVDANGREVPTGDAGFLVFNRPWPGFFRPVQPVDENPKEYWTEFGDPSEEWIYFSEDGAIVDDDNYVTILGRLDDVINVGYYSKNRVHVGEIEQAIQTIDGVEEVAVVCGDHDIKGKAPYAFVACSENSPTGLHTCITDTVEQELAALACPEAIFVVPELPRTYTDGVLRQVLEDLLNGEYLGNTDLLRNPGVLDQIAVEIRHQKSLIDS